MSPHYLDRPAIFVLRSNVGCSTLALLLCGDTGVRPRRFLRITTSFLVTVPLLVTGLIWLLSFRCFGLSDDLDVGLITATDLVECGFRGTDTTVLLVDFFDNLAAFMSDLIDSMIRFLA